jgi:hypothetical protein
MVCDPRVVYGYNPATQLYPHLVAGTCNNDINPLVAQIVGLTPEQAALMAQQQGQMQQAYYIPQNVLHNALAQQGFVEVLTRGAPSGVSVSTRAGDGAASTGGREHGSYAEGA